MTETVQGQCHCKAVTITVPQAAHFAFSCHCDGCRKLSSGGRLLSHSIAKADVTIDGDVSSYTYAGGSGKDIILSFCPKCSTQLYAEPTAFPGMLAVRASVLDNANDFTPMQFLHTDGAFCWDKTA